MRLTMSERRLFAREAVARYRQATKKGRSQILDEFVRQTHFKRKYASWLLRNWGRRVFAWVDGQPIRIVVGAPRIKRPRKRPRFYDKAVFEAVKLIWYLFDFMCGKRLVVLIRDILEELISSKELKVTAQVKQKLLRISAATVDRLLRNEKRKLTLKSRSHTKPGTLLKHQIPIRTFSEWKDHKPGFFEIDLVGHDGGNSEGEYAYTLTATDVESGWS